MIKMTREMKEKLAFAKDLLRYCRQELSPEEKERMQQVIAGNPELEELVRELMDKESVGEEIRLMAEFDTEKALRKVKGRMGRRIGYGWWAVAASVVLAVGVSLFFYLKPGEDKVLMKNLVQPGVDVRVLIGPEGDFSPAEIALALQHGYRPISLGHSRLRTETAALVAVHTVALINE